MNIKPTRSLGRVWLRGGHAGIPRRAWCKGARQRGKGKIGNSNFNIVDPDGHTVEIVQYEPDRWTRQANAKYLPDARISSHMTHVGVTVRKLDAAMSFYGGLLDFQEFWRGSSSGSVLSWVNMRVPDGTDYLEFMLYSKPPDAKELGVKNHICLVTPNIEKAVAEPNARAQAANYTRPIDIKVGKTGSVRRICSIRTAPASS